MLFDRLQKRAECRWIECGYHYRIITYGKIRCLFFPYLVCFVKNEKPGFFIKMQIPIEFFRQIRSAAQTCGLEASTRCRSKSASSSSSRVALNAATRSFGRSRMKPTVSVITTTSLSLGKRSRLLAVSSVAKNLSSTKTSLFVREFRKVDFPAFV